MRSGSIFRGIILPLILWSVSLGTYAQLQVPALEGKRVHDQAGVLSAQTVQTLELQLKLHEDSTGNQIAILVINSLNGESIEDFSLRVAHDAWKLGSSKNDNGVLLLVAVEDRKMRIEVGQGLEGVLTDALCSQIIRNEMAPNFRQGDYDAGILLAIHAIIQAIGGEYVADENNFEQGSDWGIGDRIFSGLFIFVILGIFTFAGLRTKGGGSWVLYVFLMPFYALFPHASIGYTGGAVLFILYLVGYPVLRSIFKKKGWQDDGSNSGGSSGGGWSSGSGWYSGGSSWGGSSGGGFSGGGGSFGGGGSSGSW